MSGDVPLSPIQWDFFNQSLPETHHYNQAIMVAIAPSVSTDILRIALNALIDHHDGLRLRFRPSSSGWQQWYAAPESATVPLDELELTDESDATIMKAIEPLQASLDLTEGPLFRAALLRLKTTQRLLLIAHHLIVDGVSWRILLSDLLAGYEQLADQRSVLQSQSDIKQFGVEHCEPEHPLPILPAKTTAFGHWVRHLQEQSFVTEFPYWTEVCQWIPDLPADDPQGSNGVVDQTERVMKLNAEQTALLKSATFPIHVVLLTALTQTLAQWSQQHTLVVDIEGHGRHGFNEAIDVSRTVGWFTASYPVRLSLPPGSLDEQLTYVQSQLLQVPNHGIGYGMLRLTEPQLQSPAEVSLNYLGQLTLPENDWVHGFVSDPVGTVRSPKGSRRYQMDLIAFIQSDQIEGDQLEMIWRYSQHRYTSATLSQLVQRYLSNITSLIAHLTQSESQLQDSSQVSHRALSDFSAARVNPEQLSQLMQKLHARGRA
jgi:non-ribosomal peptide synthase protein (TIGR01720 family)